MTIRNNEIRNNAPVSSPVPRDPDPEPQDPQVLGPPGSRSLIIVLIQIWILPLTSRKLVLKTLISTVL
jgi:hypothetical protein